MGRNSLRRKGDFFAKRRFSQNFLKDKNIARKIVNSVNIPAPVAALEIGAGTGMLTQYLVRSFPRVIAVEVDSQLVKMLSEKLGQPENLQVIQQDFLSVDLANLIGILPEGAKIVVGNLPYHITTPVLFKILDNHSFFRQAIFMVQKEVGQRIAATPGGKRYGILSVFSQLYAKVEYLFSVPAHLFYPKPGVDSGVIRLTFRQGRENIPLDIELFRTIVRGTFNQRRKMLQNTLSRLFPQTILNRLEIDLSRRPETLSVEEFIQLTDQIKKIKNIERQ